MCLRVLAIIFYDECSDIEYISIKLINYKCTVFEQENGSQKKKNNIKFRKYWHIHVNITCTKCSLGLRICTIATYCYSRTHESYRYYIWRMFLSVSCERKMWVPFGVNMYLSSVTCICHYECKPIFHIYCVYMGF